MEKFYTLFVATDELLSSPAILWYSQLHDLRVAVGKAEEISITLPFYVHSSLHKEISIIYNPASITIEGAEVNEQKGTHGIFTSVTMKILALDIGTTNLGFAPPEKAALYSENAFTTKVIALA